MGALPDWVVSLGGQVPNVRNGFFFLPRVCTFLICFSNNLMGMRMSLARTVHGAARLSRVYGNGMVSVRGFAVSV